MRKGLFRNPVDMALFRLGEKVKLHCHLEATSGGSGAWGEKRPSRGQRQM